MGELKSLTNIPCICCGCIFKCIVISLNLSEEYRSCYVTFAFVHKQFFLLAKSV